MRNEKQTFRSCSTELFNFSGFFSIEILIKLSNCLRVFCFLLLGESIFVPNFDGTYCKPFSYAATFRINAFEQRVWNIRGLFVLRENHFQEKLKLHKRSWREWVVLNGISCVKPHSMWKTLNYYFIYLCLSVLLKRLRLVCVCMHAWHRIPHEFIWCMHINGDMIPYQIFFFFHVHILLATPLWVINVEIYICRGHARTWSFMCYFLK